MNIIGKALEELYRIFSVVNVDKFDGVLPEPVITIQKTKGSMLGHFTIDKVWRDKNSIRSEDEFIFVDNADEQSFYEINIDPRWFYSRTVEQIVETMIHEMCHYFNRINNIKDCSGNVHNKKFKSLAENVGLIVEKGKSVGWGYTSLSPELESYIKEKVKPDAKAFEYFRAGVLKESKPKKSSFKYTCPDCGQIVRGKKGISVKCGNCDIIMEMETDDSESDNDD